MSMDRCVSGCPCETLSVFIGDVDFSFWIEKLFCKAKVNEINVVRMLACSHEKVVRFDISMDEISLMSELKIIQLNILTKRSTYKLQYYLYGRFQVEFPTTYIK